MFTLNLDGHFAREADLKSTSVTMVRIYITESAKLLTTIMNYLHKEAKVRGVSVFRAISGFGDSGEHHAALMDLSLNLPLTVEFFDSPEKIKVALDHLGTLVRPEHIVFWDVQALDSVDSE